MDNQARVVLPQKLRDKGKLNAEVVVLGKLIYLEVQNEKEFEERVLASELTAEERKAVAAITRRQG
jgi:DNA-binding transcriptional regulator/RsmH inhibitor MraZ